MPTKTNSSTSPNSFNKYLSIIGSVVVAICLFSIGFLSGKLWGGSVADTDAPIYKIVGELQNEDITELDFDLFWEVWGTLESRYVDPSIDEKELYYGAIQGMVAGVGDPVTVYLTPEQTDAYLQGNEGRFEGIGAELGYKEGTLIVVTPLEGSPAKDAGILAGDRILEVDGADVTGVNIYEVVSMIRGDAGTNVVVSVIHEGETASVDIEITRGEITVPSVEFDGMQGEIAVIDADRFTEESLVAWEGRWNDVVSEVVASNPSAVILDLRGNPGGYFDAAVWAAGEFLPSGSIIAKQQNRNGQEIEFKVSRDGRLLDIPMVVLVDGGSASASEILAGALKHYGRVYVIGENTYGKGTAQEIVNYGDGSSLHITTLKWLMPDGTWLNPDNVIIPNEIVEFDDEAFKEGRDPQMQRAIDYLNSL